MSKKELQRNIKRNGGYIFSDGTLNVEHLLSRAHRHMTYHNLRTSLISRIENVFGYRDSKETKMVRDTGLHLLVQFGHIGLNNDYDTMEMANDTWYDVCNYFDSIAPKNYYFGSQEGDGSLIGFWEVEQE